MSTDLYLEQIEGSTLPKETIEAASDALGFTQSFHDVLKDWGVVTTETPDVAVLEKVFEGLLAELSAASIFLASYDQLVKELRVVAKNASSTKEVPAILVTGYKKLADRVEKTQKSILDM